MPQIDEEELSRKVLKGGENRERNSEFGFRISELPHVPTPAPPEEGRGGESGGFLLN
jgi:hypothetical protein